MTESLKHSFDDYMPSSASRVGGLSIVVEKEGKSVSKRASYPIRYGKYSEIKTKDFEFHFNLKGEIKFIRGLSKTWPHPSEWLKRSDGNDWTYYSVGAANNFSRVSDLTGEYYLPYPAYTTNSIIDYNFYSNPGIAGAFAAWSQVYADICCMQKDRLIPKVRNFLELVAENSEEKLFEESRRLHSIIGGSISVLPPDSRHADYEIIPLNIADGCLYNCRFCCVKSGRRLEVRPYSSVEEQIRQLKLFYGKNLSNYNAIFLGNHDGLAAGADIISKAAYDSISGFGFKIDDETKPKMFMFGSVGTFLGSKNGVFERINSLPFKTYINIGLESVDKETLELINKPLSPAKVREAFFRMLEINREYANIEMSANFLLGESLPKNHKETLSGLLSEIPGNRPEKGAVYISPLKDSHKKAELLESFFEIKGKSRMDTFIYLIQRL